MVRIAGDSAALKLIPESWQQVPNGDAEPDPEKRLRLVQWDSDASPDSPEAEALALREGFTQTTWERSGKDGLRRKWRRQWRARQARISAVGNASSNGHVTVELVNSTVDRNRRLAEFAARLVAARKKHGLSQVKLSDLTGIKEDTLRLYEHARRWPTEGTVELLAQKLGEPFESLWPQRLPSAHSNDSPSKETETV